MRAFLYTFAFCLFFTLCVLISERLSHFLTRQVVWLSEYEKSKRAQGVPEYLLPSGFLTGLFTLVLLIGGAVVLAKSTAFSS